MFVCDIVCEGEASLRKVFTRQLSDLWHTEATYRQHIANEIRVKQASVGVIGPAVHSGLHLQ